MLLRALRTQIDAACRGCCPRPADGRSHTSAQRGRHGGVVRRLDGTTAYSPIWDFTDTEVHSYLHRHHIPTNPVYRKLIDLGAPPHLQRVGLTVDATSSGLGRFTWLRRGWPDLFDQLTQALPRLRDQL